MNQENTDTILYNIDDKILKDAIDKSNSKATKMTYGLNNISIDGNKILIKNKKKNPYDKYRRTFTERKA